MPDNNVLQARYGTSEATSGMIIAITTTATITIVMTLRVFALKKFIIDLHAVR